VPAIPTEAFIRDRDTRGGLIAYTHKIAQTANRLVSAWNTRFPFADTEASISTHSGIILDAYNQDGRTLGQRFPASAWGVFSRAHRGETHLIAEHGLLGGSSVEPTVTQATDYARSEVILDRYGKRSGERWGVYRDGYRDRKKRLIEIRADGSWWHPQGKIVETDGGLISLGTFQADTIAERTAGAGVTVDGCLIKDGVAANAGLLDGLDSLAFLKADGTVALTGNLAVNAGVTIDGYDIGATLDIAVLDTDIGATVQAFDVTLTSIALLGAAGKTIYTTADDTWAETTLTAFARTLLDDVDAAAARTTLVAPGLSVANTFAAANTFNAGIKIPAGQVVELNPTGASYSLQAASGALRFTANAVDGFDLLSTGVLAVAAGAIQIGDQLGTLYQLGTAITATATAINDLARKSVAQTFTGLQTFGDGIAADTVAEKTGAAGVTVDGVLLKDGGATLTGAGILSAAAPTLRWIETDASANQGTWEWLPSGESFYLRALSDDLATTNNAISIERSGTATVDSVSLWAGAVESLKAEVDGIRTVGGIVTTLCFIDLAVTQNVEGEYQPVAGSATGQDLHEYVMPFAGSIVGISVSASEARATGTAMYTVVKNTLTTGFAVQLNGTDDTYVHDTQPIGSDTFVAGDRIACWLTSVSFTPAVNVQITIFVEFNTTTI